MNAQQKLYGGRSEPWGIALGLAHSGPASTADRSPAVADVGVESDDAAIQYPPRA